MKKKYTITIRQDIEIDFPYYFRYEFLTYVCFGKITEETISVIEMSFKSIEGSPTWDYQFTVGKTDETLIETYLGYNNCYKTTEDEWNEHLEKFNEYFNRKFGNINQIM